MAGDVKFANEPKTKGKTSTLQKSDKVQSERRPLPQRKSAKAASVTKKIAPASTSTAKTRSSKLKDAASTQKSPKDVSENLDVATLKFDEAPMLSAKKLQNTESAMAFIHPQKRSSFSGEGIPDVDRAKAGSSKGNAPNAIDSEELVSSEYVNVNGGVISTTPKIDRLILSKSQRTKIRKKAKRDSRALVSPKSSVPADGVQSAVDDLTNMDTGFSASTVRCLMSEYVFELRNACSTRTNCR
jgi:hypothetical protein